MGLQGLRRAWHTHGILMSLVSMQRVLQKHFKLLYASEGMQGQKSCMIIGRKLIGTAHWYRPLCM